MKKVLVSIAVVVSLISCHQDEEPTHPIFKLTMTNSPYGDAPTWMLSNKFGLMLNKTI